MKNKENNIWKCYKCFVSGKMLIISIIITFVSILLSALITLTVPDTIAIIAGTIMLLYYCAMIFDIMKDYEYFGGIAVKKHTSADYLRSSNRGEAVLKKALIADTAVHWIKGILLTTVMLLLIGFADKPVFEVSTLTIVLFFISLAVTYIIIVITTILLTRRYANSPSIHITLACAVPIIMTLIFTDPAFNMFLNNKAYPLLALTILYILIAIAVTILGIRICIKVYRSRFADS